MRHIHVAALETDAELVKKIGKKGSESDFSIYNCKEGNEVLCLYHPVKYPEKIQPLLYCLELCDVAYFRPAAIDKFAGETIIAAAALGKKLIIVADLVGRADLEPLLKSAGIAAYEFFDGDANALREKLLSESSTRAREGTAEIIVDSCFPVKGVGTVALGIVQKGSARVHQKLTFLPSGTEAEVKSIQVQDENVNDAEAGSRVGLNLKGVDPEKVGKGDLAVEEKFAPVSRFEADVSLSRFYRGNFEQAQFFVLDGLKFSASKAKKTGASFEIESYSPLCVRPGERLCLFVPEAMPRVIGSAIVAKTL